MGTLTEILIARQIQKTTLIDIDRMKCLVIEIIYVLGSRLPKFSEDLVHGRIMSVGVKAIQET